MVLAQDDFFNRWEEFERKFFKKLDKRIEAFRGKSKKEFYTVEELASANKQSVWYTRKLCREGVYLAEKKNGKFYISRDEFLRIIKRIGLMDDPD